MFSWWRHFNSQISWNEGQTRLDKIKFKKGLLTKSCKVTGKVDLKLCKSTSKQFSQIIFKSSVQAKRQNCKSIKFRKGLLYRAVSVHGNWQKNISLELEERFLNFMTKHNKRYILDFKKSANHNEKGFREKCSAEGKDVSAI